jgi:endonuclease/exonuclease/phosphatase family metal-dependent hydrolase
LYGVTLPQALPSRVRGASITLLWLLLSLFFLPGFHSPVKPAEHPFPPGSKKTLRVMTYNIHVGVGMDKKLDLQRIADVINSQHPDLVGLQEVDRGVKRTEGRDEIAELAKLTAMNFAFAHNLDYQDGQYGVAILSRFPIGVIDHRKYENKREAERRGMVRVEVDISGKTINFVTTHLDYQYEDGRVFETEQLLEFLAPQKAPLIVVGDFNDEPTGNAYKLMLKRFDDAWLGSRAKGEGWSYPADKPVKRIDYIFTRSSDRIRTKQAWIVSTLASDHLPVVADLEIR